jgi:uncharacterized membrane protein YfcA
MIIGCGVGFIGGFQGFAGGFYIAMLLAFTGIAENQRKAAGTTLLAIVFPISIGAVYEYWKTDDIDIPIALLITFFYMIFAWIGAKANAQVSERFVVLSLAFLILVTSFYFFYRYACLL